MRFHEHCGDNIEFFEGRTVAYRSSSFANAIVFSERPLKVGEVFMVEIDRVENGWSGHMRIGLTQLNPNSSPRLPKYAVPDLNTTGRAWIYAVSKTHFHVYDGISEPVTLPPRRPLLSVFESPSTSDAETSSAGSSYEDSCLSSNSSAGTPNPTGTPNRSPRLPTDVKSRIGVYYQLSPFGTAQMHFIVNGEEHGPSTIEIPVDDNKPLFAVADVYGTTKRIRIVPYATTVPDLRDVCRLSILRNVDAEDVPSLPLPKRLRRYLLENTSYSYLIADDGDDDINVEYALSEEEFLFELAKKLQCDLSVYQEI